MDLSLAKLSLGAGSIAGLPWKPFVAYDHADYLLSATDVRRQNEARVVCPAECLTPALTELTQGPDN